MTTTQKLGPWLGINNRLPDFALHVDKKGDYLSLAENIDVDNSGNLLRRESESLLQAMTAPHSLLMISETQGYLVRAGMLYLATLSPTYSETLAKSLTSNERMTWVQAGEDIYFSNGTDSGRITGGAFFPLGLPTPAAPGTGTTTGSFFPGAYQVSVSYWNAATGEEGGVSPSSSQVVSGGLVVTLPAAVVGATHVNVYVSTVNGSIPMLAGSYAVGTATADFSAMPATLREAPQRFEAPLPAGRLFMSGSKLCSAVGKLVYVGLPYRYGYYDVVAGYLEFPETVAVAIENQMGTYVATTKKTHWFPGDLADVQGVVSDPLPFGGVPGTEFRHPSTTSCGWFSDDGFIIADTQGQVVSATADVLDQDSPAEGVANVRVTDGYVRVYSCGYCLNLESNAVTEYLGYDFTSFAGDYGTKADGVYVLTGGPDIAWRYGLGKQNFGSEAIKYMPAIYLGCSSPEPLSVRIKTADGDDYDYEARSCSDTIKQHRVDPGLGLESNWFDLELFGKSDFTLASISFAPTASTRRI